MRLARPESVAAQGRRRSVAWLAGRRRRWIPAPAAAVHLSRLPPCVSGQAGLVIANVSCGPPVGRLGSANRECVLRECFVRILKKIPGLMIVDENGKRRGSEGRGREEKQAGLGPEAYDTRDRGFGRKEVERIRSPTWRCCCWLLVAHCWGLPTLPLGTAG